MNRKNFIKNLAIGTGAFLTGVSFIKADYDKNHVYHSSIVSNNNIIKCDGLSDNTISFRNWLKNELIVFDDEKYSYRFFEEENNIEGLKRGILFNDVDNNKFFYAFFRKDIDFLYISYQRHINGSPIMIRYKNEDSYAGILNKEFNNYLMKLNTQIVTGFYQPYIPLIITS